MELLFRFDNPRPHQKLMMDDIYSSLSDARDMLVNAPTGVGKTDAAIAAALTFARKENMDVFFLTPKISQHKIAVESLAGIRKKFKAEIKFVDIVGKRNLCINPSVNAIEGEAFYKSCENLVSSKKCVFYTNSKEQSNITSDIVEASHRGHNAIFEESYRKGLCAYEVATHLAKDANFIIADYAHILNPHTKQAFLKRIAHRLENAIVIWDEAHNVLSAASSYMSTSISSKTVLNAAKELHSIESSIDIGYLDFMLKRIAEKRLSREQEAFVESNDIPADFMENIPVVAEQLEKAGMEYLGRSKAKRSALMHVSRFLLSLAVKDNSMASIISRNGSAVKMALTCLYPERSVELFREPYANIFMSGTLLPLHMYRELFGLHDAETKNYASNFPKANKLCLVDQGVSTKYESRSEDEYKRIAKRIGGIRLHMKGNLAVFFPSFDVLNSVYRHMQTGVEFIQRRETMSIGTEGLIEGFKKSSGSTLFAVMGGSLSEGIDYSNNVIKGIIIVGIPLEKPNLELRAKIEYMNRKFDGKGSDYAYIVPGIIRAAQAAGRAIRSETDRAFIVFMDKRYGWSSYKSLINNFMELSDEKDCIAGIERFMEAGYLLKKKAEDEVA